MFGTVYNYFFGVDNVSPAINDINSDGNEWIFVDCEKTSGRSSPVLVADPDMQELNDDDVESISNEKLTPQMNGQQASRKWLRKTRKDLSNQTPTAKQSISELIKRRQEVEKMLFEDSSGNDSSSASSSPMAACSPSSITKPIDNAKTMISRKKKYGNIKQPRSVKNDSRKSNNAK